MEVGKCQHVPLCVLLADAVLSYLFRVSRGCLASAKIIAHFSLLTIFFTLLIVNSKFEAIFLFCKNPPESPKRDATDATSRDPDPT